MAKSNKTGITRRDVIKGAGALAGAAIGTGAITGFPYIMAQEKMTLRYLGTAGTSRPTSPRSASRIPASSWNIFR